MRRWTMALGLVMLATGGRLAAEPARSGAAAAKPASKPAPGAATGSQAARSGALRPASRPQAPDRTPADLPLDAETLEIAQRVHHGHLPCEMGASVRIKPDPARPGYFNVQGKGFHYRMHPVASRTGAIRLEDQKAGAVWLQLANKSMLMDQKKGRRLADDCAHPEQLAYAAEMKNNPPPTLFDTTGMGRND